MPRPFYVLIKQYQWAHLVLGIAGNISFVVGSIFYLHESLKTPGTWLFIAGSTGMLVGSLGSAAVKLTEKRRRGRRALSHRRSHPLAPRTG